MSDGYTKESYTNRVNLSNRVSNRIVGASPLPLCPIEVTRPLVSNSNSSRRGLFSYGSSRLLILEMSHNVNNRTSARKEDSIPIVHGNFPLDFLPFDLEWL